jgi:uncharacterized tellurite resistance protein B-like protein
MYNIPPLTAEAAVMIFSFIEVDSSVHQKDRKMIKEICYMRK